MGARGRAEVVGDSQLPKRRTRIQVVQRRIMTFVREPCGQGTGEDSPKYRSIKLIGAYLKRKICQWGVVVSSPTVARLKFNQHRHSRPRSWPGSTVGLGLGLVVDALDSVADQSGRVVLLDAVRVKASS